jgi:hypothetical protein
VDELGQKSDLFRRRLMAPLNLGRGGVVFAGADVLYWPVVKVEHVLNLAGGR